MLKSVFKSYLSKKCICIFITILILTFMFFMKLMYGNGISTVLSGDMSWIKVLGVIGWGTLIWSIVSWRYLRDEVICLYSMFIIIFYLFTFGQSLLIVFNLVPDKSNLLNIVSTHKYVNSQIFTMISLTAFHLGALITCKKPNYNYDLDFNSSINLKQDDDNKNEEATYKAIKYTGLILLILSIPGFTYNMVKTFTIVMRYGYRGLFGYDGNVVSVGLLEHIFQYTGSYFLPSLICLLIFYRKKVVKRNIIYFIMILNILANLYIGGRAEAIILILSLICIHHYSIKRISKKNIIYFIIFFYILISLFGTIAQLRDASNRTLLDYIDAFSNSFTTENLFIDTISEIGGSMFPLSAVMKLIPDRYEFYHGKSYIYSLFSIIPNLGFWSIHPSKIYSNGSEWLMKALKMNYGPGFSLIAEAYRNFGWYGFIVLMFGGNIFGRIYSSVDRFTINIKPELFCVVIIFFNSTLVSIRGDSLYIVRPLFYIVIPIYVAIKLIRNYLLSKSRKRNYYIRNRSRQ